MAFSIPRIALPRMRSGGAAAGLVIRAKEVDLLSMAAGAVTNRIRVPIDGTEDYHVTDAIRKAVEAANLKGPRLVVSIPTQHVLFRFFTIPNVPKHEWDSVVQYEARKYIPFKIEWLVWDYRVLPSATAGKLDVIFTAIQREMFRRMQELLENAGVQPLVIEPRSLSLARLVPYAGKDAPNDFTCLVDIEQEAAHLAIVKDRLPYLTRDVSFTLATEPAATEPPAGGLAPTDPLETPLPVPEVASADDGTDPKLKRLFSELSVSMDFFMREYPSTRIGRVVMFGEEGQVSAWAGWLSERLQTTVELGNVVLDQRMAGELPLSFAAAVGLLQAGGRSGSIEFLKRSQAKVSAAPKLSVASSTAAAGGELSAALKNPAALAVAGAIAALMMVATWFIDAQRVASATHRLQQLTKTAPRVGLGLDALEMTRLKELHGALQARAATLSTAMGRQASVAAKLDGLVRSLPEGVWMTHLVYEQKLDAGGSVQPRLAVSGACFLGETTKELAAIQEFQEQVKRNPQLFDGFTAAQLDQINESRDAQQPQYTFRTFQLNCRSGRAGG